MSVIIRGKNPRKPHTVRYWVDGRQRERSFATAREAQDFKIKTDHDTRAQIFVDDKLGREDFGQAVDAWPCRPPARTASSPARAGVLYASRVCGHVRDHPLRIRVLCVQI